MRKLIEQLMKLGIVGIIAFVIDWGTLNLLVSILHVHDVLVATISFIISLVLNYLASMRFVSEHRDNMTHWMEILIFVAGAVVSLLMNGAITWISTYGIDHDAYVSQHAEYLLRTNIGKLTVTTVVMIRNFLIRKRLLDGTHTNAMSRLKSAENRLSTEELEAKWQNSFSHKLDIWFPKHTPKGWPR